MSTGCGIAVQQTDGTYLYTSIHFDGYPAGVGRMLLDYYQKRQQAQHLVEMGDMRAIGRIPYDPGAAWRETFLASHYDHENSEERWDRYDKFVNSYCEPYGAQWPTQTATNYTQVKRKFTHSDQEWLYVYDMQHGWRTISKYDQTTYSAPRLTKLEPIVVAHEKMIANQH